ncbi:hypothetical protein ACWY4P_48280 [Streptomyces sp. LZ34]
MCDAASACAEELMARCAARWSIEQAFAGARNRLPQAVRRKS